MSFLRTPDYCPRGHAFSLVPVDSKQGRNLFVEYWIPAPRFCGDMFRNENDNFKIIYSVSNQNRGRNETWNCDLSGSG